MTRFLQDLVNQLMDLSQINAIIFDIGSSGYAQSNHSLIASRSTIVGFEPDSRGQDSNFAAGFRDSRLISKAIVDDENAETVNFVLTKYSSCSSILEPDLESLKAFAFHDYFIPTKRVSVPALTLNRLVEQENLKTIDWLKVDAQGADLRLVKSLNQKLLSELIAVEVEPGVIDAYLGESLFPETHDFFRSQGFWLADLDTQKYPRISLETKKRFEQKLQIQDLTPMMGKSPTCCEARYFRTIQFLDKNVTDPTKLIKAFLFGISCDHLEYSLEVMSLFERKFKKAEELQLMEKIVVQIVSDKQVKKITQQKPKGWRGTIKSLIKRTPLAHLL